MATFDKLNFRFAPTQIIANGNINLKRALLFTLRSSQYFMCRASYQHRLKGYFKDERFFSALDDGRETKESRKTRLQNMFTIMQNLPLCFN